MNCLIDPRARIVVAHRGASAEEPENTIRAFRRAVELGADAIELEVRLSRDGIPVVTHDPTLMRMSGVDGRVADRTAAELARMPVGNTIGIPTLNDVLEQVDLPILVEVKEPEAQEAVAGAILARDAADRVVLASEHDDALDAFRREPFLVGASGPDILRLWIAPLRGLPDRSVVAYSVPVRHKGILPVATHRLIRDAHILGAAVHVWTVDQPAQARRLWDRGANGILTNDPALLLRHR